MNDKLKKTKKRGWLIPFIVVDEKFTKFGCIHCTPVEEAKCLIACGACAYPDCGLKHIEPNDSWEERFDELFLDGRYDNRLMKRNLVKGYTQTAKIKDIKQFIQQELDRVLEEKEDDLNSIYVFFYDLSKQQLREELLSKLKPLNKSNATTKGEFNRGYNSAIRGIIDLIKKK